MVVVLGACSRSASAAAAWRRLAHHTATTRCVLGQEHTNGNGIRGSKAELKEGAKGEPRLEGGAIPAPGSTTWLQRGVCCNKMSIPVAASS